MEGGFELRAGESGSGSFRCRICGRALSRLDSIRVGIGPVCRGRCGGEVDVEADAQPSLEGFDGDIVCRRTADGAVVNIPQTIVYHSPTGFEWGYGGSGPADLALNTLLVFTDRETALRLYQRFKEQFVAPMPHEGGVIRGVDVKAWIECHRVREA